VQQEMLKIQSPSQWSNSLFKPKPHILSILPQTPVRALSISETTGLIAAGYSTGIVIFEPSSGRIIFSKNFLNYQGSFGLKCVKYCFFLGIQTVLAGEKPLNRLKTMKQTVRKTFRGRSLRMSRVSIKIALPKTITL
jgi:hypothetical protein